MTLLIFLILIISEALYEGLYDNGKKALAGVLEFFSKLLTMGMIILWLNGTDYEFVRRELWVLIGGYILLRFALFDAVYNLMRDLPVFYVGETKIYDKVWKAFFRWTNISVGHFLFMAKLIALLISVSWLLNIEEWINKL